MDEEDQLAKELERTREDPGEWGNDAVEIGVRPSMSQVVSFRLPLEEVELLTASAAALGETLSQFIRKSIEMRSRRMALPTVNLTLTGVSMTVRYSPADSGRNEADPAYVSNLG